MIYSDLEQVEWVLSQESLEKVKAGTARIDSGGVRDNSGKIIEQVKPIIKHKNSGELSAPPSLTAANFLTSDKINELIQNNTKITNSKLEQFTEKTSSLLKLSNGLSWVNAALGVANCGLTYALYKKQTDQIQQSFDEQNEMLNDIYFSITNLHNGIDKIIMKLDEISLAIKKQETKKFRDNIRKYGLYSKEYRDHLTNNDSISSQTEIEIALFLTDFSNFLEDLVTDIITHDIDSDLGIKLLFSLGSSFADLANLFSAYFYQKNKREPTHYDMWLNRIESIGNNHELQNIIKETIMLQSPEIYPLEKKNVYDLLSSTFPDYSYQLQVNRHENKILCDKYDGKSLEEILEEKIKKDEKLIID